jgi:hypothetical protein
MDESCSNNYAYISCCLIIILNIIYLGFKLIKLYIQHQRQKMTDNTSEPPTTTSSSRMATRSTTVAAAAKTTNNKNGYERLAQLYSHVGDDIHLPMKWNGKEKAQTLVLQQNDLVVTYKGIYSLLKYHQDYGIIFFKDLVNHIKMQLVFVLIILFHH